MRAGRLQLLDDLGHGEGFAGAGDTEQDLVLFAGVEAGDEFGDGAGLVALRLVVVTSWKSIST